MIPLKKLELLKYGAPVKLEALRTSHPEIYHKLKQSGYDQEAPLHALSANDLKTLNRDGLLDPPVSIRQLQEIAQEESRVEQAKQQRRVQERPSVIISKLRSKQ